MRRAKYIISIFIVVISILFLSAYPAIAQSPIPIECGAIVEAELTPDTPFQEYRLQVQAGTILNLSVEPIGSTFNVFLFFLDSGGSQFAVLNEAAAGGSEEFLEYQISSSNPVLHVIGVDPSATWDNVSVGSSYLGKHFGAYTIYLGCTLRDGTVIEPGQQAPEPTPVIPTLPATQSPDDPNFRGFPGIPPVSFLDGIAIPLNIDLPNAGSIAPGFESVFRLYVRWCKC